MEIQTGSGTINLPSNLSSLNISFNEHNRTGDTPFDWCLINSDSIWLSNEDQDSAIKQNSIWAVTLFFPHGSGLFCGSSLQKAIQCANLKARCH